MTAGTEVICNDVVCKVEVEVEEKCDADLTSCDLNDVGVIATVDENVGDRKDDTDESSYVFVSDGVEVSADEPDDTGGVNVDDLAHKSDSADEVEELKKEELGIENRGIGVDSLESETKGVVEGSMMVSESEVKGVEEVVNLENGSTVDPVLMLGTNGVAEDVNGALEKILGEEEVVVKNGEEVDDANEIQNVETDTDDIGSGVTFDPEFTLNTIEKSAITVTESDSTINQSDVTITQSLSMPDVISKTDESLSPLYTVSNTDCEGTANDGPESSSNLIDEAECQVTVDGCGKPYEDLECEVRADESESSGSPTEGQVTVNEYGKPSEDLSSQVIADDPESSESPVKERECKVSVDGADSISNFVDNQECLVSIESEPSGNHTEEVDGKSEEHQELLVITSEITVEAEPNCVSDAIEAGNQNLSVSVPCQSENKKVEVTDTVLSTESEENLESRLVLSEDTAVLANGQAEKFDGILEMREAQISGAEADRSVPLMLNAEMKNSEEKLEMQIEESSEMLLKVTESVEFEVNSEDVKEQVKTEDEIRESHVVVTDSVEGDLSLKDNTTEFAKEAEVPLETETSVEPIVHVNTDSQYEVINSTDKPQEGLRPEGSFENVETVSECNNSELLVVKDIDSLSNPDELIVVDQKAEFVANLGMENRSAEDMDCGTGIENGDVSEDDEKETEVKDAPVAPHLVTENRAAEDMDCGTGVENGNVAEDDEKETEVKDAPVEYAPHLVTENTAAEDMDCGTGIENGNVSEDDEKDTEVKDAPVEYAPHLVTENRAAEDMDCGTGVENVDVFDDEEKGVEVKDTTVESAPHLVIENYSAAPAEGMDCGTVGVDIDFPDDEEKVTEEVKDAPVGGHSTLSFSDTIVNLGGVIEFGSIGRHETTLNIQKEAEDVDGIQTDEIPTSSVEGSVADSIDVQNEVAEVLPYNFLIKIPRYEDESFRDQIRSAQLLVDEKTRIRDAIRVEIQGKRAKLKSHNEAYNAAKAEETAARRLVRLKRQEIDSVQVVINRWKNAMSVEDIDGRISSMEHMIQHETLLLKDEKQFIREIKQLKTLRDQLASNMGSPEEIRQAKDQKDHNEERMKTLRKELDSLKDKALKAEAAVKTVGKTYDEESRRERELQAQFRAADDVRQKAYAHLNSLRKLSYDKNKSFRQFKEDLMAARNHASHGNKNELHRLCANQVETFMEQWNNNDEFRKEYVSKCNIIASRRQRALDGGPLIPDDVAYVLPGNVDEKVNNGLVSVPAEVKSVTVVSPVEERKIVSSTENKHTDNNNNNSNSRSIENVSGQKNQSLKTKGVAKRTALRSDDMEVVAELPVDNKKEEADALTKEEIELAKKAEELRKEEIAAKLKEQRRLEEKAKAIEALERKKRKAEKDKIRAELRARKEAEQKEKEREKRLRKKEKKKTGGEDGSMNGEEAAASAESANEAATKVTDTVPKETLKKKAPPPPHFYSKQLKSKPIPPPLVNRNKKRWQQWGKYALAVASIFVLFLLGNTSYLRLMLSTLI